MLARTPSSDTKWIFDPAPGGIYKWYIRMSVSKQGLDCMLPPLLPPPLLPPPLLPPLLSLHKLLCDLALDGHESDCLHYNACTPA
jgi:hypothetical protein